VEFSKPVYAVDVLKVGVPVAMAFVEGVARTNTEQVYTREEAKAHFRRASDAAKLPFIYLSEGVSNETFNAALQIAAEAGSGFCGVLCGRATWKNGVEIFVKQGMDGLNAWLADEGVRNIENVNKQLNAAKSWFDAYEAPASGAVSR
jgi:tagatose 1,6-diphosphate aldolase